MPTVLTAYHGTAPDAPLVGGKDPVSANTLQALWASNSYYLAAQFQDGEVRKLSVSLENPLIIHCAGNSVPHAKIVRDAMSKDAEHDGVIFIDTIDGMEVGDVIAVFGRKLQSSLSVDHAVKVTGSRIYDHGLDLWVSQGDFTQDVDSLPQRASWDLELAA
jgi:hypothetical protein